MPEVNFSKKTLNHRIKGFTLIELLVVISIIAILAGLLMSNFVGVRQRGRDAQRKADIQQIRSALELYRADMGAYPIIVGGWAYSTAGDSWIPGLTPQYMQKVPKDPVNNATQPWLSGNYSYAYFSAGLCTVASGGKYYALAIRLENTSDQTTGNTVNYGGSGDSACNIGPFANTYFVTNP